MKVRIFFSVVIIFTLTAFAPDILNKEHLANNSDCVKDNLQGRVKTTIVTSHQQSMPESEAVANTPGKKTEFTMKTVVDYDKQGHKVEEDEFFGTYAAIKHSYKYDSYGRLIEEVETDSNDNAPMMNSRSRALYKYDDKGKIMNAKGYVTGEGRNFEVYRKYDTLGRCIEYGEVGRIHKYQYDNHGNVVIEAFKDNNDPTQKIFNKKYDSLNRLVATEYLQDSSLIVASIFKYDDAGRLLEGIDRYPQGDTITRMCSYDIYGNELSENTYSTFEKGTVGDKSHVLASTYKYKYDDKGNWIIKETYSAGVLTVTEERKIYYYQGVRIIDGDK